MSLGEVDSFEFEERGQAEGPAINVKYKDSDSFTEENEFYQLPGIASGPTKGDRVVILPIEGGYRVIIAAHNYKVGVDVQPGETKVFSTDASGNTKQAEIWLKATGEIEITGDVKFKGSVTVEQDIIVEGTSEFQGASEFQSAVDILDDLTVLGATTLIDTLSVTGAVTMAAAASVGAALTVVGDAIISLKSFLTHVHKDVTPGVGNSGTIL